MVEGPVLVAEAVRAGWRVVTQFVPADTPDAAVEGAGEIVTVATDVLERLGSTKTPQAPVAIVEMRPAGAELLDRADVVVVLDRIGDPGNLGTMLRSAEAAGVDAVVVTPGSVDAYNPKVVRASAGALFHVPVIDAGLDEVDAAGLELVGTSSHDRADRAVQAYTSADLSGRIAIVMGSEAHGLPEDWNVATGPVRRWVTIPHRGRSESLNVAMAMTVLVFEVARQRSS